MVISRIITHIIDKERKSNLEKPNATHNAHPKVAYRHFYAHSCHLNWQLLLP